MRQSIAVTIATSADGATPTEFTGTRINADTGDTFQLTSLAAETDYTVTVGADLDADPPTGGFNNPDSAGTFEVSFAQGDINQPGKRRSL